MERSYHEDVDATAARAFRSVLPHEPLPQDKLGYIHLQGGFEPKRKPSYSYNNNKIIIADDTNTIRNGEDKKACYWSKENLENAVRQFFSSSATERIDTDVTSIFIPHADCLQSVEILEDSSSPPYTKFRLCYTNPLAALEVVQVCRAAKLSPQHIFSHVRLLQQAHEQQEWQFTSRQIQITQLTQQPFLSSDIAWNRSNPPKFRRLLCRPGEDVQLLQEERESTRFVYISGLVQPTVPKIADWWDQQRNVCETIRYQVDRYDTSGQGVEIYVSNKKQTIRSCHVGMRSSQDARALIAGLQGAFVEWTLPWNANHDTDSANFTEGTSTAIPSDSLFLDYAAITKRSTARAEAREKGEEIIKGEPSRSECTTATKHIFIPGLVLIPDFLSEAEEEVLMAALNGPTAPWAPSQTNFSQSGAVKRKVQHYGYVFDYETADVKRDRSLPGSDCPPLPGLPEFLKAEDDAETVSDKTDAMETFFRQSVSEGRGWDALACTMERARLKEITVPNESSGESKATVKRHANLNQITVNFYEPGEGIGSHVDTPSAFDDGVISISVNSGIVMEFRKHNSPDKLKKLVYLPARSLLLMSGPARYEWEHMIVTRSTDTHEGKVLPRGLRVSLTLRTAIDLLGDPLPRITSRNFPPVWGASSGSQADARVTPKMEREHVHAVYDAIATQWHHTRGRRGTLWPGATQFLQELPPGSLVADVGCGDGKYFPAIWEAGSYVIGSDISLPLLQQAAYRDRVQDLNKNSEPASRQVSEHRHHLRKMPAVAVADCMNVPLRDKSCDAAICIAVMHHLSTRERRLRCISELARIVKVGGTINIQAWAMEQQEKSKRKFAGTDVFVPFNAQPKYLNKVDEGFGVSESETPVSSKSMAQVYSEEYENAQFNEKNGLVVFKRYCHMYRQGELEDLVAEVDSVSLHESGYETGNHFVILKVCK